MTQSVRMMQHPQSNNVPPSHVLGGYSTIDNSQIHPSMSMMMSTLVPTQTIVTSHSQNMINSDGVISATATPASMNPVRHLVLESPKEEPGQRDQEKKMRREIANSNERRRMQSINSGFKSLKTILPHTDGEKLSKAAILQQTSEYITQLESDKLRLMHQNERLRRALSDCKCNIVRHRSLGDIFDKDEGIGSPAEEDFEDMRRGLIEIRQQLDKERRMRMRYEEQVRGLESQLYPERVQSMKSSSGDERRSSSEYSPSVSRPMMSKPQNCARPLLPPLAPLAKTERTETISLPQISINHTMASSVLSSPAGINQIMQPIRIPAHASESTLQSKPNTDLREVKTAVYNTVTVKPENSVTVFSHSTKSNQPLKKRAIEIHQSFTDATDDSSSHQPSMKVAKISIDQLPDIGTRSFLPPTLPPIFFDPVKSAPPIMHILPTSRFNAIPPPPSTVTLPLPNSVTMPFYNSSSAAPSPLVISHGDGTHAKILQRPPTSQLTPFIVQETPSHTVAFMTTPLPPPASIYTAPVLSMLPVSGSSSLGDCSLANHENSHAPSQLPNLLKDCQHPSLEIHPKPMFIHVAGQQPQVGASVHYHQKDPETTCQQLGPPLSSQHFIVAPVSTMCISNTMQNPVPDITRNEPGVHMVIQQPRCSQSIDVSQHSTIIQTMPVPGFPQQSVPCNTSTTMYESIHHTQPPTFLHFATVPKNLNESKQIMQGQDQCSRPSPRTILCHGQPEITLNQLNTMPNVLAPSRNVQQLIPQPTPTFVVQQFGSNSPSYASQALQDAGMLQRATAYILPSSTRCRKSSMSVTDSCSTASVSGAEEEEARNPLLEDPDSQTGETVPTIKLSQSHTIDAAATKTPPKTPPQTGVVAAYDEVQDATSTPKKISHHRGVDVADSPHSLGESRVSLLANPAGSPPLIRHIDAIQTRRNLETIVQAIDHLEQQERRNSQDRQEVSSD